MRYARVRRTVLFLRVSLVVAFVLDFGRLLANADERPQWNPGVEFGTVRAPEPRDR
jgi:hypothetical protein